MINLGSIGKKLFRELSRILPLRSKAENKTRASVNGIAQRGEKLLLEMKFGKK